MKLAWWDLLEANLDSPCPGRGCSFDVNHAILTYLGGPRQWQRGGGERGGALFSCMSREMFGRYLSRKQSAKTSGKCLVENLPRKKCMENVSDA